MSEMKYEFLRGRIKIANRGTDGNPLALYDCGDTTDLEMALETKYIENFDNDNAISTQDLSVAHQVAGTIKFSVKKVSEKIHELALFGDAVTESGGDFAAIAFPSGIQAGETWRVPGNRANLSDIVMVDSTPVTPLAMVLGTNYTIDLVNGTVTFLTITSKVQPFKISGNELESQVSIPLLNRRTQELYIICEGINIADQDDPVITDFYRVTVGPATKMLLKGSGEEPQMLEFEGKLLKDGTKSATGPLGQFGRKRWVAGSPGA